MEAVDLHGNMQAFLYPGGMVAAVILHGTVQPETGMLLLMSASTLEPGSSPEGGGWRLTIKRKCQLLPYIGGEGGRSWPTQQHEGREWNVVVDFGNHSRVGQQLRRWDWSLAD